MHAWPLILVVDDAPSDVQIISEILRSEFLIKVAANGTDALAIAVRNPVPDLILLDIVMPDMDGFEVFKRLRQHASTRDIPVIFVTAFHEESHELRAMDLQAADYITKPYSAPVTRARIRNKLLARLKSPGSGAATPAKPGWFGRKSVAESPAGARLGKRETEVLALIAKGLTSAQIAEQLFIAKGTVEVHRENIMRKLNVHNIAGLVQCAFRNGLITP
jgi:putative two-component system response regulator